MKMNRQRPATQKREFPKNYPTIMRLEERIYENAARLFEDACALYEARSFPSSYALGILAYEELGKLAMVDHVGFEAHLSDKASRWDRLEHLFSHKMFYSHTNKQAWGAYKPMKGGKFARVEEHLYSGKLEQNKQDALYVGFRKKRVIVPEKFVASYPYNHLKYTLGLFEEIADLPFVWVFEKSTKRTRNRAEKTISHLRTLFSGLVSPKKVRGRWGAMESE
jgi:AbiV family abortive infection protein